MARRQISMHHQIEVRQVDAACCHVGCDADPGTPVTHGLQSACAFGLRQLARQCHNLKTAVRQTGQQAVHCGTGIGKNDGVRSLVKPQDVDDRILDIMGGNHMREIGNIAVLLGLVDC